MINFRSSQMYSWCQCAWGPIMHLWFISRRPCDTASMLGRCWQVPARASIGQILAQCRMFTRILHHNNKAAPVWAYLSHSPSFFLGFSIPFQQYLTYIFTWLHWCTLTTRLLSTSMYLYASFTSRCEDRRECRVPATKTLFTDPCPGTYKYFEMEYFCVGKTILRERCVRVLMCMDKVRFFLDVCGVGMHENPLYMPWITIRLPQKGSSCLHMPFILAVDSILVISLRISLRTDSYTFTTYNELDSQKRCVS